MAQAVLTPQELADVKDYVLENLPRILEQDPRFVLFIEGIVNEKFPRRDEFARLLDEFTSFRKETRENFDQVDHRFNLVDQRLDNVDQRFDQVDQRFDQVDQRFDQVDQRFEQVDQRFESLTQEVRNLRDWVEVIAGDLQNRAGKNLENVVAGALQLGLRRPDIQPEHVLLRQKISDPDGLVFKAGKQKEVDIVATNGELLVFEVKSAPKPDDVDDFADKVELVRLQNPAKQVQGVFVAVGSEERIRQLCSQRNLLLIPES
jgi:hypothetical protein